MASLRLAVPGCCCMLRHSTGVSLSAPAKFECSRDRFAFHSVGFLREGNSRGVCKPRLPTNPYYPLRLLENSRPGCPELLLEFRFRPVLRVCYQDNPKSTSRNPRKPKPAPPPLSTPHKEQTLMAKTEISPSATSERLGCPF